LVFYPVLGLTGEACEVCEKVKKLFRDQSGKVPLGFIEAVTAELGYVLCHVAAIFKELNVRVSEVARKNIEKLHLGNLRAVVRG
jgi:NTP pyrophosphatase (non-canonical NTP hydrolase)